MATSPPTRHLMRRSGAMKRLNVVLSASPAWVLKNLNWPAWCASVSIASILPLKRRASRLTWTRKLEREATHRDPSSESPPPGTIICTCGWWVRVEPQVCSTAVMPILAPRRLGLAAMASVVSAAEGARHGRGPATSASAGPLLVRVVLFSCLRPPMDAALADRRARSSHLSGRGLPLLGADGADLSSLSGGAGRRSPRRHPAYHREHAAVQGDRRVDCDEPVRAGPKRVADRIRRSGPS